MEYLEAHFWAWTSEKEKRWQNACEKPPGMVWI